MKGSDSPYIKVIQTGHVIEVYEIEKAPYMGDKSRKDKMDYDALDMYWMLNASPEEIQEKNKLLTLEMFWLNAERELQRGDRTMERREQTVRDAKNRLRRIANANFSEINLFMTMTYSYDIEDVSKGDKHFSDFITNLREETGQKFNYIAVREFTKKGRLHYHMITDVNLYWDDDEDILKSLERDVAKVWGQGFVDIKRMDRHNSRQKRFKDKGIDNVGAYMTKYFSKSIDDERLYGHKMYLTSQGLIRPVELTQEDAEKVLRDYGFTKENETFTNGYESEYLGKISYKEYNLKRLIKQGN